MLFRVQGFGQNRARLQKLVSRDGTNMGSSLNFGPFGGPFYKDAVLYWGPKKGPDFGELPFSIFMYGHCRGLL